MTYIINTLRGMDDIKKYLDEFKEHEKLIEGLKSNIPENEYNEINVLLSDVRHLLNFNLIISVLNYDIKCTIKAAMEKDGEPEILFYAKQLTVIVRESYRTILGFNEQSNYIKTVIHVIETHFQERKQELNSLVAQAKGFENMISEIKDMRDLSVHYDQDPVKLYDLLMGIDTNETFGKYNRYICVLHQLNDFVKTIARLHMQNIAKYFMDKNDKN